MRNSTRAAFVRPLLLVVGLVSVVAFGVVVATLIKSVEPQTMEWQSIDVQANLFTPSAQEQVAVASTPSGGTIAVWASRRQEQGSYGIYARAFDGDGRARTGEVHVNSTERGLQHRPALATDPHGVWFVWESIGQDGSGAGVVARRFDHNLAPLSGEIAVNTDTLGDQGEPVVATSSEGTLVTWSTQDGRELGIRGRRLHLEGEPAGAPFSISDQPTDATPTVAALPDGDFAVAWSRTTGSARVDTDLANLSRASRLEPASNAPARRFEILGRRVAADGQAMGRELTLSDGHGVEPALTVDTEGSWVATWLRPRPTPQSGGYDVALRRFDRDGRALARSRVISASSRGQNSAPSVASHVDGGFVVSYLDERIARSPRLTARHFNSDGEPTDGARPVRSSLQRTENNAREYAPATSGATRSAVTAAGTLVFAWQGQSGSDPNGANLTYLSLAGDIGTAPNPPVIASAASRATDVAGARPPIWNPDFVAQTRRPASENLGGDFGFEAIVNAPWTPPDPEMAVGPEQVLVMTNGAIAAFDKLGNEQWTDEIEDSFGFWGELGAGNFVFDPEATWDPHARRFVTMANEQTGFRSYVLLAISKDERPDDRDDWHKYRLDVTGIADSGIDSPNLGLSRDYILFTADFFGPDRYLFLVIDKNSVLEGGAPISNSELFTGGQSMGVPVVYSDTGTLYAVQAEENFFGENNAITLHGITDPIDNYSRVTFDLPVAPYVTFPADPPQLGSGSRPNLFESRFWSVAEQNGAIWAVHHVGADRARVRWYEIELNGWPTGGTPAVADFGEIDLGDGISTFFPSIHADSADNVAITFARSAANEYFSIGRVLRAAGDSAGTFRPAQIVQTSQNPHSTGRWGDYSGTQADPQDADTFWGHHEFTDGNNSSWRTWVGRFDLRAEPMLLSVDSVVAGQTATFDVTGATPNADVFLIFGFDGTGITEIGALQVAASVEAPAGFLQTTANGAGEATFNVDVPSTASGREVVLQAAEMNRTTNWEVEVVQ